MPSRSANNANLDKTNFDMLTKLIAVQPSMTAYEMNNVPNESGIIMLSYTEINFVASFFDLEKFAVKPRVSFF